jgi:hypothetical protein
MMENIVPFRPAAAGIAKLLDQAEAHETARLRLIDYPDAVEVMTDHDVAGSKALIAAIERVAAGPGFAGIEARDSRGRPLGAVVGIWEPGDGPYLRTEHGEAVWWMELYGFYTARYLALRGSRATGLAATVQALRSRAEARP